MRIYPLLLTQFDHQFIKGQVTLFRDPMRYPTRHSRKLAMPAAVALALGFQPARRAPQKHHIVHKLDRNPELRRCCPVAVTLSHEINDPLPKLQRKWFAHQ